MRKFLFAAVTGTMATLTPAVAQAPGLQAYSSNDLGFTVDFPGIPTRSDQTVQTAGGPIIMKSVHIAGDNNAFIVDVADLSTINVGAPSDPVVTAQGAVDAIIGAQGTALYQSSFAVPGGAGKEEVGSMEGGRTVRVRVYYVRPVLYQLIVIVSGTNGQEAVMTGDYARFFDSFRMLVK